MIIDFDNYQILDYNLILPGLQTIPYDEVDSSTVTKDCSIFEL